MLDWVMVGDVCLWSKTVETLPFPLWLSGDCFFCLFPFSSESDWVFLTLLVSNSFLQGKIKQSQRIQIDWKGREWRVQPVKIKGYIQEEQELFFPSHEIKDKFTVLCRRSREKLARSSSYNTKNVFKAQTSNCQHHNVIDDGLWKGKGSSCWEQNKDSVSFSYDHTKGWCIQKKDDYGTKLLYGTIFHHSGVAWLSAGW